MAFLLCLLLLVLLSSTLGSGALARGHKPAVHRRLANARSIDARQAVGSLPPAPNAPKMGPGPQVISASNVLATFTPSPSASPIQITQQSQVVTTFVPQFTLCELPPIAFFPVSVTNSGSIGPQLLNLSTGYSVSIPPGNGTCSTFLSPTQTTVCATTLTGLATTYPVTDCAQQITFSSQLGYTLVTPTATPTNGSIAAGNYSNSSLITPASSIQTLTTYYLAPWQELTSAGTPPADVDVKICSAALGDTNECLSEHETWVTQLTTIASTITSSINFTATLPGPSQLIVETIVANITDTLTTLTMATNMVLDVNLITETLSTSRVSSEVSTEVPSTVLSTDTSTITVFPASKYQPM
ncbi:hypothetical protein EV356DRAFT_124781 [Viridothelium virens]|uniref:Uncharacterized protein n=1 Tax=Viridothelium virens TaxID=1048519 RepID=A0A6A6HB81_VIRVR|nr:hypothetical protein EV356DRAFT_124781 [Viridothelium virens]